MQVYSPVAIFPVVFSTAVTCRTSGVAMPVVVLKQTVTVPLPSGTSTLGTSGTTLATIAEREREDGESIGEGKEEKERTVNAQEVMLHVC